MRTVADQTQASQYFAEGRLYCYFVAATSRDENGYIPSIVFQNAAGHFPLTGNGPHATPWYAGTTYPEAEEWVRHMNQTKLGLDAEQAAMIVASSMGAANEARRGRG